VGLSGVYDFIAESYGWGRDYVDNVLTDEQLVAYLDAAQERIEVRGRSEFEGWVEAVRVGYIFARDGKQYDRWRTSSRSRVKRGLTGAALEQAVMRIASMFPDNVQVGKTADGAQQIYWSARSAQIPNATAPGPRKRPPLVVIAWAAGFFDGEGCVYGYDGVQNGGYRRFTFGVTVTQVVPGPLDRLLEHWGGAIRSQPQANPAHRHQSRWDVRGAQAAAFPRGHPALPRGEARGGRRRVAVPVPEPSARRRLQLRGSR
jgi:hypothetical protein